MKLHIKTQNGLLTAKIMAFAISIGAVFYFSTLIVAALPGQVQNELINNATQTNVSPNPGSYRLYWTGNGNVFSWGGSIFSGGNGQSSGNGFKHVLKNEKSSQVRFLELRAYFKTDAEARAAVFEIRNDFCSLGFKNGGNDASETNPNYVLEHKQMLVLYIDRNEAAGDPGDLKYYVNGGNGNQANACNAFNANYSTAHAPIYDPGSNLYYHELWFQMRGNVYTGPDANANPARGPNQIHFAVRASAGGVIGFKKEANSSNFGLSEHHGSSGQYGVAAGVPFGSPCTAADVVTNPNQLRINIYDPDAQRGGFGNSYVYVMKRPTGSGNNAWTKLAHGEYNESFSNMFNAVNWQSDGSERYLITGGNGATSWFTLGSMIKNYDYMLIFDNPYNGSRSGNGNVLSFSAPADTINAQVSCTYDLQPSVTQPTPDVVSPGGILSVSGGVSNVDLTGGVTGDHTWQQYVAKFSQKPNKALPDIDAAADPCNVIPSASRYGCTQFGGNYTYPAQQVTGGLSFTTDPNDPPGAYICFITRVLNPTEVAGDDTAWRYTDMECSLVGKKPKVQVLGTDLKVNGVISTSITESVSGGQQKTFGSWVEYGVFSTGMNSLASSGAGLSGGNTTPATSKAQWSKLTFSNKINQPTDFYGSYQPLTLGNARTVFGNMSTTPGPVDLANSGVYDIGNATLGGSTNINIPAGIKGKTLILRGDTITIDGNITVDNNGRSNVGEISQIVILANTINVRSNVTNVDAWLLTRNGGTINTCIDGPAALTVNDCNNQLVVNGGVMTNHLVLKRTAGAGGTDPERAAEVFRLRPDAQLWAYNYANQGDRAQTVYVIELPPRF